MKHKHHIIPRHMGGTDDPENLVEVSVEEHAALHKQLWEDLGHWQDHVAWRMLSGQITAQEATLEAIRRAQTGRVNSEEERRKKSEALRGRPVSEKTRAKLSRSQKGKRRWSDEEKKRIGSQHKGKTLSDEHRETLRQTHRGKPKTDEQKRKMAEARKLWWSKKKDQNFAQ